MPTRYNIIAGQNLDRVKALSDGVFAIAMTLLVIELHTPAAEAIRSEAGLWHALVELSPRLIVYVMSFVTLGIFWIGQQTAHDLVARSDRAFTWLNLAILMSVTLVPFSTALLSDFITYRVALLVYWANLFAYGVTAGAAIYRAHAFGLLKPDQRPAFDALVRRVIVGQSLYAFGAALCVFSTWWSIGLIFGVQLVYAIGPRFWPFNRL